MVYRVCKSFEVESGHMLSKHPGRCRYPHGHSRRVDVVVAADALDAHDMVCDFKALRLALESYLDRFDHALAINSADPARERLTDELGGRLVVYENTDPTTEVMARDIYDHLAAIIARAEPLTDNDGNRYELPKGLLVERVRVTETSTSWAEYGQA
ncbi:MAG: 6-carboxytetrahydropterin synthase [Planctomycetota bacterium]